MPLCFCVSDSVYKRNFVTWIGSGEAFVYFIVYYINVYSTKPRSLEDLQARITHVVAGNTKISFPRTRELNNPLY